jgi:hypothetical protein
VPLDVQEIFRCGVEASSKGGSGDLSSHAAKLYARLDGALLELSSTAGPLECRLGCDSCCHRLVSVTYAELEAIQQAIMNWEPERQSRFVLRLRAEHEATASYWGYEGDSYGGQCPFLVEGVCEVYEQRPAECRGLASTSALACEQALNQEYPLPYLFSHRKLAAEASRASIHGLQAGGGDPRTFDLSHALYTRYVLGSMDLKTAVLRSGPLGEPASEIVSTTLNHPVYKRSKEKWSVDPDQAWQILSPFRTKAFGLLGRMTLPLGYRSSDDLESWWQRMDQAISDFENSNLNPQEVFESMALWTSSNTAYAGRNVKDYLSRIQAKAAEYARLAYPELADSIPLPRKPGRFRVGFIGGGLVRYSGSRWALDWLTQLGSEFETHAINIGQREDEVTGFWIRNADYFHSYQATATEIAKQIRILDLDALIFTDIGAVGQIGQLSLLRLARTQYSCWGHPTTSGSPQIDFFLSSDLMEPENGSDHYSETLIRLPNLGFRLGPLDARPSTKSHSDLGLPTAGYIANVQHPAKLLPEFDSIYLEICDRLNLPMVFVNRIEDGGRFEQRLRSAGMNACLLPKLSPWDYLRVLQLSNFVIDAPAFNGAYTTVDALSVGKPMVSLAGEFMRSRQTFGFATLARVPGIVASSLEDFVALACDENRQQKAMQSLDLGEVFRDRTPVPALAEILHAHGRV